MDSETLEALGESAEVPTTDPPATDSRPSDLGQEENETPDQLIARGVIPDGYTRDPKTKEIRPKKTRGRPRLGASSPAPNRGKPINRDQDVTPDSSHKGKTPKGTPKWQKGVIATGMTKLYKRTGRIIKAMDRDIGIAVIESAEDCGEAWDELARTNPRIRTFLMRMIAGGAWGSLIMAHAPILMAIVMKDGIRKHIPFMKLVESVMEDDAEDESEDNGGLFSALEKMRPEDMQQMMGLAQEMFGGMASRVVPGTVVRGNDSE